MLRRCVSLVRGIVNITPRLPPNHAQFYHKEVSNVQVSCSLGVIKEVIDNWIQIVGQKRAYFLAVRQPDKGERFLKLTERSGGHHTYISINLRFAFACLSNFFELIWPDLFSDLGVFLKSIENASKGEKVNRSLSAQWALLTHSKI